MEISTPHTDIVAEDLGRLPRAFDTTNGKKATAAGKPLEKKPTLLKSEMKVIEKTSKYEVSKGAEQLATFLRSYHKV